MQKFLHRYATNYCPSSAENKNVIQVDHHKLVKMCAKDVIDDLHDNGKSITQAKSHKWPLKETKLGLERCLLDVIMIHMNLAITKARSNLVKYLAPLS